VAAIILNNNEIRAVMEVTNRFNVKAGDGRRTEDVVVPKRSVASVQRAYVEGFVEASVGQSLTKSKE
jgi:hypothetical protein